MSHPALRILDANLNRAREALRVMEEFARFVLDDASLTEAVKKMRHALAAAVPPDLAAAALRHRDIVSDVGREISTPAEFRRRDELSVAVAAGKRLSEALRAIEEYAKPIDASTAQAIERIRYEGYELERRIAIIAGARERLAGLGLYVIITESLCKGDWFATARAALEGGADMIQLREKGLSDRELLDRATRLTTLCHDHGALFIMNDRVDIAAACGADGAHLGQDDLPVTAARKILPDRAIVGVSTHTIAQAREAIDAAPDYVAVGPMFATSTKPQEHVAGPSTLVEARRLTGIPFVAIGGIGMENVDSVVGAAACIVCVCTAVIARDDPKHAARQLRDAIERARSNTAEPSASADTHNARSASDRAY